MGRKKKYVTESDKIGANRKKAMRYYSRNKRFVQEKNLKRYHENKRDL